MVHQLMVRHPAGRICTLLLACCLSAPAAGVISVQRLDRAQKLASSQAHAVVQGADGAIYIAGPAGLSRYDGAATEILGINQGLTTQGLRALAPGPSGTLWIGGDRGVDVMDADGIRPLVDPAQWRYGIVEDIAIAPDGTAWIASAKGLLSWRGGVLKQAAGVPVGLFQVVETGPGGELWAAGPATGLWRASRRGWEPVAATLWQAAGRPRSLTRAAGGLLVGGDQGLVELILEPQSAPSGSRVVEIAGPVYSLRVDGESLWISAAGKLHRYRRGEAGWQAVEQVFEHTIVNDIALDAQGNVWLATDSDGVAKVPALWRALTRLPSPCTTSVYAIAPSADGSMLIAGDRCSWRWWQDDRRSELLTGLDRIKVWDILEDGRGGIWAATELGLRYRDPDGVFKPRTEGHSAVAGPTRVLLPQQERMLVGTVGGLIAVADDVVAELTTIDGGSLGYVYTLEYDPEGVVWAGTLGNGLWRQTPAGAFERVVHEGLTPEGNVYSLAFDGRGGRVVLQDDRVVLRKDGRSILAAPSSGDSIAGWSVAFDGHGRVWVGGNTGLYMYPPGGEREALRIASSLGLPGEEFTTSRSLFLAADGRLMGGVSGGLFTADTEALAGPWPPPVVRVSSVQWMNAEEGVGAQSRTVEAGNWSLDLRLFAPWFLDEQHLAYRHRLAGFDQGWIEGVFAAGYRAHYTSLPPGDYLLSAQAYSPLTGWGPEKSLLAFTVIPKWWLRPLALALWLLLGLGLIALGWRAATRALTQQRDRLQRAVDRQTRELSKQSDEFRRLAYRDNLTGLLNQRSFWSFADKFEANARSRQIGFSLLLIDLDHFKRINDSYGHRTGDHALEHAAGILQSVAREQDFLGRYGGEEFALLLWESDPEVLRKVGERIRVQFESHPFQDERHGSIPLTASIGVGVWQGDGDNIEALFQRADAAVYAAKRTRNACVLWSPVLERETG